MIEISKELLSEVYNFEVKDFVQLGTDDVTYEIRFKGLKKGTNYNIINIYELAHKCKEWAFKQGYFLSSGYDITGAWCLDRVSNIAFVGQNDFYTEPQAIFKACEWILKEIKK